MSIIEILAIAVALAMDAFAVSISYGCSPAGLCRKNIFYVAFSFGLFQGVMPLIGWSFGLVFTDGIRLYAHWIAFALLAYIGLKMISEGIRESNDPPHCENILDYRRLLILSVATSIDALAVGVSFSVINNPILIPAIIIGVVTFFTSFYGVVAGQKMREHIGQKMEIAGGIILLAIGTKILLENLTFS